MKKSQSEWDNLDRIGAKVAAAAGLKKALAIAIATSLGGSDQAEMVENYLKIEISKSAWLYSSVVKSMS